MVSAEGPPYKMSTLDTDINQHFQDAIDVIQHHSDSSYCDPGYKYYETLGSQQPLGCHISCYLVTPGHADSLGPVYDWSSTSLGSSAPLGSQLLQSSSAQQPWHLGAPDVSVGQPVPLEASPFYPVLPIPRNGKGRKKLRLYEYLHEALSDPAMADSIQWTDTANGTFHFVSKNKERLAECWGQRKGNRKTMTYQKMARALRNYSRSGEIIKVRRKLTYQFNPVILQRLGGAEQGPQQLRSPVSPSVPGLGPQGAPAEPGCYGPDWYSWYGHYPLQEQWFSGPDPRHL